MTPTTLLALIGILLSIIFSSGFGVFFVRYGTRLTLLEHDLRGLSNISTRVSMVEASLLRLDAYIVKIDTAVARLSQLDVITEQLKNIGTLVASSVPRQEIEARLKSGDVRLNKVEEDVVTIDRKVESLRHPENSGG